VKMLNSAIQPKLAKWDQWAIRAQLRRRGHTFQKLAAESGFAASTLSAALIRPSTRVNRFIASKLGITPHELWPDWFYEDGDLIPARHRQKLSRKRQQMASPQSVPA
jgi:Ner family transcriptional regulator